MSDAPRLGGRTKDDLFGALLFVGALIPRVCIVRACAGEPVWDGHYYDYGARRIAAGFGYSDDRSIAGLLVWHPWCHYPVGYSAFLAAFYRIFGATHAVAGAANALVGAALAVVTWALAARALSPARARLAGCMVALHPGLILYSALVMSEPLAALLTLTAFLVAVNDDRSPRAPLLGAVVLGVAALVRPQALLCAPFLALVGARSVRSRAAVALAACAFAMVPILPWTARNCRVMDGCALVSTNGGWNLAIGAFPRATGRFETLRSSDGCRDVTGQVQQDRCWWKYGVEQIRERPLRWLSLVPAKLGFTFDHESFAVEYLREAKPDVWSEERRVRARDATTWIHRVLLAAAALGCIGVPRLRVAPVPGDFERARRTRTRALLAQGALFLMAAALAAHGFAADVPTFWPLAAFTAAVPWIPLAGRPRFPPALALCAALLGTLIVTHAVFFGEDRYHIVVTPVLAIFAAGALRRSTGEWPGASTH